MNRQTFTDALRRIYAAHGKTFSDSVAVTSIFRRVDTLPDGFIAWAADKLEDSPDLPKNLGYHLKHSLWPDYLEANPGLRASYRRDACPQCSPDTPGWILGWKDRQRTAFRCCCNSDPRFVHLEAWTRPQVEAAGYALEAPGIDYWRAQVQNWREGKPYQRPCGMRGIVGRREEPKRPDHARALQEAGNW